MRALTVLLAFAVMAPWAAPALAVPAAPVATTSAFEFVKEYIRELSEMESIRADAEASLTNNAVEQLSEGIHSSTRTELALRMDIARLQGVHLKSQFAFVPTQLIQMDQQKIQIHDRLVEIATEFMSGPKPGVNYGGMAAEMPKLRALLESADEGLLTLSAGAFASLIDEKPDKNNHMSRLTITSAQRQELLDDLKTDFGSKLDGKKHNAYTGAADVLRAYLRKEKGFKCTDEPD